MYTFLLDISFRENVTDHIIILYFAPKLTVQETTIYVFILQFTAINYILPSSAKKVQHNALCKDHRH